MSLNWYPGHMAKATREIKETLPKVDMVIEVLDARIPYSSGNPVISDITDNKPCVKLLTKSDLADPELTQQWLAAFEQQSNTQALATTTKQPETIRALIAIILKTFPQKAKGPKAINAMIMGIPNVGKSTTLNILADRKLAKTGNEPAVTKAQQRIKLNDDIVLFDTPGILWPKIDNSNSGYRLAASGAIKDAVTESEDIAFFLLEYLIAAYPDLLKERFNLDPLPQTPLEFLETVGQSRGKLRAGGRVDLEDISRVIIGEFRAGTLGRITLETPEMAKAEALEAVEKAKERAAKKAKRKKRFKDSRKD